METTTHPETALGRVLTLPQLAAQLGVTVQTLHDLRSQGRGPRGFRVGREVRFRVSEVDAWLAQMEVDDAERHPRQAGDARRPPPAPRSAPTARSTPGVTAVVWWRRPASVTWTVAFVKSEPPGQVRPPRAPA